MNRQRSSKFVTDDLIGHIERRFEGEEKAASPVRYSFLIGWIRNSKTRSRLSPSLSLLAKSHLSSHAPILLQSKKKMGSVFHRKTLNHIKLPRSRDHVQRSSVKKRVCVCFVFLSQVFRSAHLLTGT